MNIYLITGNQNKFAEANQIITNLIHVDLELSEIQETDPKAIIRAKLQEALKFHDGPLLVEDTSLSLDCLNGLPGPLIKWFEMTIGNEGIYQLAMKLGNTSARARVIVGLAFHIDDIHFFEGTLSGDIISARGTSGFGWDPIFRPDGFESSLAELSIEEKNRISMRKNALIKVKEYLESLNITK